MYLRTIIQTPFTNSLAKNKIIELDNIVNFLNLLLKLLFFKKYPTKTFYYFNNF